MNLTRKSPETCSRMVSTFCRLIFLGSFVFVQQEVHEISQFSMPAILKQIKYNSSKIAALAHTFVVKSFYRL